MLFVFGLVVATWTALSDNKKLETNTSSSSAGASSSTSRNDGSRVSGRQKRSKAKFIQSYLLELSQEWESASLVIQGAELVARRTALINEAADRLRGEDLADFLDIVIKGGEFSTYSIPVIAASQILFGDADELLQNKLAREWIAEIANADTRQRMAFNLGLSYRGSDISVVLNCFNDLKTKQSTLDAYCSNMAINSPCSAFRVYQENLPQDGDYSGLTVIAANMKSEFREFLTMLPGDERLLVSKARNQVLISWAHQNPLDAANFVLENSDKIKPEYLAGVVSTWMGSDPNTAINWARKQADPVYRDNSFRGVVDFWKQPEPEKAWELILNEGGIDSARSDLLKRIHAEWIKFDPKAAESAKIRYQNSIGQR